MGVGLSSDALVLGKRFPSPHLTRRVALPSGGCAFPLTAEHNRRNYTLGGEHKLTSQPAVSASLRPYPHMIRARPTLMASLVVGATWGSVGSVRTAWAERAIKPPYISALVEEWIPPGRGPHRCSLLSRGCKWHGQGARHSVLTRSTRGPPLIGHSPGSPDAPRTRRCTQLCPLRFLG